MTSNGSGALAVALFLLALGVWAVGLIGTDEDDDLDDGAVEIQIEGRA